MGELAVAVIDAMCWHPRMSSRNGFRVPKGTVCLILKTSGRYPRAMIAGRVCTIHPTDFRAISGKED